MKSLLLLASLLVATLGADSTDLPPPPPKNPVSLIGDSITYQGGWIKVLGRTDVTNWGIPGYTTGQLARTFKDLLRQQPGVKVVFLEGGINDLTLGVPADRIFDNQVKAVAYWREHGVIPVLQSVIYKTNEPETNAIIKALNARLQAWCASAQVDYLDLNAVLAARDALRADLSTDGTHLRLEPVGNLLDCVLKKIPTSEQRHRLGVTQQRRVENPSTQRGAASDHRAQRNSVFGQQGTSSVGRLAVAFAARTRRSAKWDYYSIERTAV
jgi:lysophospholipase L1-like esterase